MLLNSPEKEEFFLQFVDESLCILHSILTTIFREFFFRQYFEFFMPLRIVMHSPRYDL
jgi:hypothetical protein